MNKPALAVLVVLIGVIIGGTALVMRSAEVQPTPLLSRDGALLLARDAKECSTAGVLTDNISYNSNSKTWWIDLERMPELENDGCNPACVVNEETNTAEVNWRCTGATVPEPTTTDCLPEQRNADFCTADYTPVCATVQVQCITTPCNPVEETFSNSCNACKNPLVSSYVAGECSQVGTAR